MAFDAWAPVLVGSGQVLQRAESVASALDPVGLMCDAVRAALGDAGLVADPDPGHAHAHAHAHDLDLLAVVSLLSWRYGDPASLVAARLGIKAREMGLTTMGGNSPQSLVNTVAGAIQRGEMDFAVLTGGEAWRTRMRARAEGVELEWEKAPDDRSPRILGEELTMSHPAEQARGVYMPVQVYPMFETAIRAAAGRSVEAQLRLASELWARFSAVAASNPNAWIQMERTAEDIRTPSASNRMIGFPYTKLMNSNNDVDMAAALVMCSAGRARQLGIEENRWIYIHSGTDCHEHAFISHRWDYAHTPAIEIGGRVALELAGLTIDEIDLVDLYSCFPSAVQLGAQSLGLDITAQLTRTGGLSFAGGPWNNYVMHAIATLTSELRAGAGRTGLVWANGGYATKHSFGVYATTPPAAGFRHACPQDEVDALPSRELAEGADAAGPVTIEAYTVMHNREGMPETAFAAVLTPGGRRAWGVSHDPALAAAMCEGEWVGRAATIDEEGTLRAEGNT